MAFNLGDIFVTFKARTEDVKAGVAKVKEQLSNAQAHVSKFNFKDFSARASQSFGNVANAIQGAITKLALFGATSSFGLGAAVKYAATLDKTSKSFQVLTGDVKVANELFAQLAKYANNTPFEFEEIAKAGQTLLGFGIQSDKVYGNVQMLGDIAAATGADFSSLALVFGQVNATGRLMGQDALQLINNKVPITTMLAKKLGVSVQEVKQRMEDGAISADLFNEAIMDATKKGGFAFEGTSKLAQSFSGRLSTLTDAAKNFGLALIGVRVDPKLGLVVKPGGVFDRLSTLMPKITDSLDELGPKIEGAMSWIMDHGEEIKAVLAGIAAGFVAAKVAAIGFAIAAAANPVGLIVTAIVAVIGALAALQVKFDWIGKTLNFLKPIWEGMVNIFNTYIKPSLEALGKTIMEELWPALKQLWDAFKRLWDALNPGLMNVLKMIGLFIGVTLVAYIWYSINALNLIVKAISLVISFISNVIKWIGNFIDKLGDLYSWSINTAKAMIAWFGRLPGAIGNVVNSIVNWFSQLPGRIGNAISGVANSLISPFRNAFNSIARLWNGTVGRLNFKVPSWVPEMGGKGWSAPTIPQLAFGTPDFAGGMAMLGEHGRELAFLPRGTQVKSNQDTEKIMSEAGGNTNIFNLSGVFARSDSELADMMEAGIKALDRRRLSTGQQPILGGSK